MKRDLSIILCILMIFSLCTFNIKADDTNNDEQKEPEQGEALDDSKAKTDGVVAQQGEAEVETKQADDNKENEVIKNACSLNLNDLTVAYNNAISNYPNNDDNVYTTSTYNKLSTALTSAKTILDTSCDDLTQEQIDTTLTTLNAAVSSLAKNVIELNGIKYESFYKANLACNKLDSCTYNVLTDFSTAGTFPTINKKDKVFTINLNGYTITRQSGDQAFEVKQGTLNIVGPGVINAPSTSKGYGVYVNPGYINTDSGNIEVNIGDDVTINAILPVIISERTGQKFNYNTILNINGTLNSNNNMSLYVSGNIQNTNNSPIINIGSKASLKGGLYGMYLAGYAKTTIADGALVSGSSSGIEIRAGKLTINGGSFKGGDALEVQANGSGTTVKGAAVAISQHASKLPIDVVINGGTFLCKQSIYETNIQNGEDTKDVNLAIYDGIFYSNIYSDDCKNFMYGGKFVNIEPVTTGEEDGSVSYIAKGYKVKDNGDGTYSVIENVATIDSSNTSTDTTLNPKMSVSKDALNSIELIREAIENGDNVEVKLEVKDSTAASDIEKIKKSLSNESLGITLDISLNAVINSKSNEIKEVNDGVEITIDIPDSLILNDTNKTRNYYIVYVHEGGEPKTIEGTLNEDNTYTFKATEFSTYALVYKDVVKETKSDTNNKETNSYVNTVKTCEEAVGRNWTWSNKSKTCVYKVTNTSSK